MAMEQKSNELSVKIVFQGKMCDIVKFFAR